MITDKKAGISSVLKYKALPHAASGLSTLNVSAETQEELHTIEFELACMKELTEEKELIADLNNDLDSLPDSKYKSLLKRFPEILKLHFEEEFTKNGIQHRIITKPDARPSRAKKRNLLPGSPKEIAAKKAFQDLIKMGIVEPVNPQDPNNWTSAIHFVPKPCKRIALVRSYMIRMKLHILIRL